MFFIRQTGECFVSFITYWIYLHPLRLSCEKTIFDLYRAYFAGIGFNLNRPDAKSTFEKIVPGKDFDKVKSGKETITKTEARALFDVSLGSLTSLLRTNFVIIYINFLVRLFQD